MVNRSNIKSVIIPLSDYNEMFERLRCIENKGFYAKFNFYPAGRYMISAAEFETKDELIADVLKKLVESEANESKLYKIPMWVRRLFNAD